MEHRNSQLRQYQENKSYFVTFNVKGGKDFFKEEIFCHLFIEELRLVKKLKRFKLHAFCINYDHIHLLLTTEEKYNVSEIMRSLKTNFSRNINKIILNKSLDSRVLKARSRDLTFISTFVNLLINHNEFLINLKAQFNQKHGHNHIFSKFYWQKSYHDHVIRDQKDYDNHFHYAIYNFLKHNLPQGWQYTSLNYSDMVDLEIEW